MTAPPTLVVNELVRSPEAGPEDRLVLSTGVNVLIGIPNTGKSKWLQMLNYLLVSKDDPADVFGEVVAEKYGALSARLSVAGETIVVERRWDDHSPRNRAVLNGEQTTVRELIVFLLKELRIPILHYPQGNPLGQRTWPELGLRSLYRHMYRRQAYWGDIADRQPESEQHACILQFTGIAERLFSDEYGQLVQKQKQVLELRAQKEQFISTLTEVSKDLLSADEAGVGLTFESLETAKQRVSSEVDRLLAERSQILHAMTATISSSMPGQEQRNTIDDLSLELSQLQDRDEQLQVAAARNLSRLSEMISFRTAIDEELNRLSRAIKAGTVLADLKLTHCPACDQPVTPRDEGTLCYLCQRPTPDMPTNANVERLELELAQTKANLAEADEMVNILERDRNRIQADATGVRLRIGIIRGLLRPVRTAAAAILPPEISVLDMKVGQLQERMAQIDRVARSLGQREVLTEKILSIQTEATRLEEEVAQQGAGLDFEHASDRLQDGMNNYLTAINHAVPNAWSQREARVSLDERKARFLVGNRKWSSQLGGTLSLYYLLAYHYALMTLASDEACHFPGFLAIDFPAELDDATVTDEESFALQPFVTLLATPGYQDCQVIAAGASFNSLDGANRIELNKVWN